MSRLLPLLALAALLVPELADACAVCFSASEESRGAFVITTIFLSVLPVALIGGFVWWLRARIRELEAERAETQPRRAV